MELYEEMVRELKGEKGKCAFGSGKGAINASTLVFLKSGDHLIAGDTLYGCTVSLFEYWALRFGIEISFVNTSSVEQVKQAYKENTKMFYLETPVNRTCKISDICSIASFCNEKKIKLVVDGTFTSTYYLKPIN